MTQRHTTRLVRFLTKAFQDANLQAVIDPRQRRGRRWRLDTLLKTVLLAMACGQQNLGQTEQLTQDMSPTAKRLLRIPRRVPDTTLRDLLVRIPWQTLRKLLHQVIHAAQRRKALRHDRFPCGVIAMDGKWTHTPRPHPDYTMSNGIHHLLRTVTSCLISSRARPCVDLFLLDPRHNEDRTFQEAFDALQQHIGSQFQLVTYDSGACSQANAQHVLRRQCNYLFRLKANQKTLLAEAREALESLPTDTCLAQTVDPAGTHRVVTRRLWAVRQRLCSHWNHPLTFLRVQSVREDRGCTTAENRYWISNLPLSHFEPNQWLQLVRLHWSVENHCHKTWDVSFQEDTKRWINEPAGMLAVQLLRRMTYTLLTLFRSVTQHGDKQRQIPWKELFRLLLYTCVMLPHLPGALQDIASIDSS